MQSALKTAYTNVNILDGSLNESGKMEVRKGTVIVENGTFSDVVYGENANLEGCEVRDMNNAYLMPGLINLHVHLSLPGGPTKERKKPKKKPVNYKKLFDIGTKIHLAMAIYMKIHENNAKNLLLSGVTTVRTVGGILDFDGKVRDRIKSGKLTGPRIFAANTAISVPGGHFAGSLATESKTPEEAAEDVRRIAKTNPDLIKLMITGGVMDATENGVRLHMPPEIVKAACDEAHKLGYKVAAHVESNEGVRVALENGVDTIEHGSVIDDELVALFKEKNAVDVCTLSPAIPCSYFDGVCTPEAQKLSGKVLEGVKECARICIENGIPVGMGTDTGCPYTTQYNTWRELYYMNSMLGVSYDFAIYTATKKNAEILGIDDITGTIEKGKKADFIVSEKNPLEDITTLRTLKMVSIEGKTIDNPRPKTIPEADERLDKLLK